MKTTSIKRLMAVLVVLLVALAMSNAQVVGKRISPKGTFKGQMSTLIAIGHSNPEYDRYYAGLFGESWDNGGAKVIAGPFPIPNGAYVPQNAIVGRDGKIQLRDTIQQGDDQYWVVDGEHGPKPVKSCGQAFELEFKRLQGELPPPAYETDFEMYVTLSAAASAKADATSTATSTADGGNAIVNFVAPQPLYVPQPRVLATQGSERYQVAAITWLPQTRINNVNTQSQNQGQTQQQTQQQQQQQQQQQEQMQQQLQEILNRLGIG